jgi:putative hydrolase of the HAD superfamily
MQDTRRGRQLQQLVGQPSDSERPELAYRGFLAYRQSVGRSLQGILFDLDETLYSREDAFWRWVQAEAERAGAWEKLNRDKVSELDQRGRGDKPALLEYLDTVLGWQQTRDERQERFRLGIAATVRLAPGVREMLKRVGERFKLGLISNGSSATQRAKLHGLGLEALFDPVVISEEVGFRKPDVRIFRHAIERWGASPANVLFVGDDPISDIEGARGAGLQALRVGHDAEIPSILSLEAWLKAHSE